MSVIEPNRFCPTESGVDTLVTLPGRAQSQQVRVLRLGSGLTAAHSNFEPSREHRDDIRRPFDQILLAVNLSGEMMLETAAPKATYLIANGETWIIRPDGNALLRTVKKGIGCSNLVLSLNLGELAPEVYEGLQDSLPERGVLRKISLPTSGRSSCDVIFDGCKSPAALLRKQGQCMMLIGSALEALAGGARADTAAGADLLVARARALMSERLEHAPSLEAFARELGVSHATLNRAFRSIVGRTVFEDLRHLRLARADSLVRNTDLAFSSIAYDCGFSSPAHMSSAFRKRFGASPKTRRNG